MSVFCVALLRFEETAPVRADWPMSFARVAWATHLQVLNAPQYF
jgi:hypothetical protein